MESSLTSGNHLELPEQILGTSRPKMIDFRENSATSLSFRIESWLTPPTKIPKCSEFLQVWDWSGAQVCKIVHILKHEWVFTCKDRDRAENEPRQVCCMIRVRGPWFGIVSIFDCQIALLTGLPFLNKYSQFRNVRQSCEWLARWYYCSEILWSRHHFDQMI